MRKIEQAMIAAIRAGRNWQSSNTMVRTVHATTSGATPDAHIFLHGHLIAKYCTADGDLYICLCGWNTPTTRSRLTALCREFTKANGVGTKRGQAAIRYPSHDFDIGDDEWIMV